MANQYNGQVIVDSGISRFFSQNRWVYAPRTFAFQDGSTVQTGFTVRPGTVKTKDYITAPAIDCSHFVQQTLLGAGYNVGYFTSSDFKGFLQGKQSTSQYNIVATKDIKAGDIVVFEGHVGVVKRQFKFKVQQFRNLDIADN